MRLSRGLLIWLTFDRGHLYLTLDGNHPATLNPESDTDFHTRVLPGHIHFE